MEDCLRCLQILLPVNRALEILFFLSINGIKDEDAVEPNIIKRRVFCNYSDAEREEIAGKISVIERSSTNDQLFLVQGLKKRGHVVAATGDGTNDAPVYTSGIMHS